MSGQTEIPDGWERGFVEANGIELHYCRTNGSGPPVVVSHGFTDDGYCRLDLARELGDEFDVVLYDARGHGRSAAPDEGYGPSERAADLLGLLDTLGLEDPILFGHSMGADTVTKAAATQPDRPRAVVLEDPVWMLEGVNEVIEEDPGEDIAEQIAWWRDHSVAELLEVDPMFSDLAERGQPDLARRVAEARQRLRPEIGRVSDGEFVDPIETYGDIEAPTLILKADAEEAERQREGEIAGHLRDGQIVHIEDAGHCVFWDERERATEELRAFLETV
ncbi:O-methylpimelyl-Acyl carrier protein methylesterase [Halorhabdus tiamatea SARL4B]|uniref:Alpha/beta hydrolase fold protein n=1 Tax=Halorhabdus tiamatea SARL4B TaxID=1033806 RepID=F7PJZ4_9EURY|nr:alpha/beta hydrolase [Halorhabdus tiamatea]ERJ07523.1 O-methylpimelyl-Acyl carrier protein methylesterase [Halorhabdus tiamatea SARL4B]CCQ33529.1 alpha/beta hydrolase fold protein [Halorhabdus tiamatea SARL4B]